MRPQKVLDIEILKGLTTVFRSKGYEGASLKDLSEATGLKKASLYHRFPGGKKEMADAVLLHIHAWVDTHIFQPLLEEDTPPQHRLKEALSQIHTLYHGGDETCILRALSMETGIALFEDHIKNGMKEWVSSFHKIGIALGLSPDHAEKRAIQVLIDIQGSLIVAKGMKDLSIFETTLLHIENTYLN
ncbi:TetR/AcrR family transcriptional regulator [Spongiimicrobium salis]|uniref:TetR/AcrR family transcriptional regulator n=1 Tax=Spongiimicrobium salis TaxID=1667022 RepID=UPI00374D2C8F